MSRVGDMIDGARKRYMRLPEGFRFFVALFTALVLVAAMVEGLSGWC